MASSWANTASSGASLSLLLLSSSCQLGRTESPLMGNGRRCSTIGGEREKDAYGRDQEVYE